MTSLEWLATFPELSGISDATKLAYINLASQCIDTSRYCADAAFIIALQAAHMMSLVAGSTAKVGGAGAITSIREGDISISFASNSGSAYSSSTYSQTRFGNLLLQFMKSAGAGISMDVI